MTEFFGFFQILFFILLILKLIDKIQVSWWIVTMPLWGPILAVFLITLTLAVIKTLIK